MKPIFNDLEFDGIKASEYGIYITGEAQYNAPERDVEIVEVAGRNGAILIDNGRWKNIEVTYHCGCFGEDQYEFAKKIRRFRAALASRIGYKRIVDTYNPEEYRMGAYMVPFEADTVSYNRAGEFDVTFNCKPQRYLMSGESELAVTDGQNLFNPTLFDARPLLAVEGYGNINLNGYDIDIEHVVLGKVDAIASRRSDADVNLDPTLYNSGDTLTATISVTLSIRKSVANIYSVTAQGDGNKAVLIENQTIVATHTEAVTFTAGTTDREGSITASILLGLQFYGGGTAWVTCNVTVSGITYNANSNPRFNFISVPYAPTWTIDDPAGAVSGATLSQSESVDSVIADSTVFALGHPTYIDCDLGDAYMINGGQYVSLNKYIDLGSDLPVLKSGVNEITFDDTITELKIKPNWWTL